MIEREKFEYFQLPNGLEVYVIEDKSISTAIVNILYKVGSRDETPDKTGFAHLFEHLMFGGSKNISNFDEPLQKVGGENNAFTNTDITNYYVTLPHQNIETAFWLESDRMLSLSFEQKVLDVQQSVVIEEFKQRYLNQPYGDVWLKLRPKAYTTHPYQWPTIGKKIEHIENATMQDVKDFFARYYSPNNAIMVVAGNVDARQIEKLANKWFAPIPSNGTVTRNIPAEPAQLEHRQLELEGQVPLNAIYKAYHAPAKASNGFVAIDMASDILGRGKSSVLYDTLVTKEKLFSSISSYAMGTIDPGLFVISGKLSDHVSFDDAESAVDNIIEGFKTNILGKELLDKVKNQAETGFYFGQVEMLNRAFSLAFSNYLGDNAFAEKELERTMALSTTAITDMAKAHLNHTNSTTLRYSAKH